MFRGNSFLESWNRILRKINFSAWENLEKHWLFVKKNYPTVSELSGASIRPGAH